MDLPLAQPHRARQPGTFGDCSDAARRARQALEQAIEVEVRDALQAVRSSEQRLEAAASAARRYALEQYESERRRFESGLSTVFLVLERQTSFVTAQALELRAGPI